LGGVSGHNLTQRKKANPTASYSATPGAKISLHQGAGAAIPLAFFAATFIGYFN
jgi:hypothetical protein